LHYDLLTACYQREQIELLVGQINVRALGDDHGGQLHQGFSQLIKVRGLIQLLAYLENVRFQLLDSQQSLRQLRLCLLIYLDGLIFDRIDIIILCRFEMLVVKLQLFDSGSQSLYYHLALTFLLPLHFSLFQLHTFTLFQLQIQLFNDFYLPVNLGLETTTLHR
jgi:hypothetical protein